MNKYIKFQKGGDSEQMTNTNKNPKAIAQIRSHDEKKILGYITFEETSDGTIIKGDLDGFQGLVNDGEHGMHIHEKGDPKGCCDSLGGHYNPFNKLHSSRTKINEFGQEVVNTDRHLGDLGNIMVKNGKANINMVDPLIKLIGPYSIIGRSIIIHEGTDDLGLGSFPDSKTTGHSGARAFYGIVGRLN